jgi:glycosyltransferase involved in cell wall biosynthesis
MEIIVSDNFSQDRTREIVESYKDPRIRYINTGKRLSMTDNFEFALSHVRPEGYVIYIGDDDGLLPNAIRDMNAVITQTGAHVLQWDVPIYNWPTLESNNAIWWLIPNRLLIPSLVSGTTVRNSATTIQNVLSFKATFESLPMMYMHSAIGYEVIKRIKESSGRFYHSMIPDVYSGFAIAWAVDSFVHSRRPYAIAGVSHHSNGASTASGSSSSSEAFQKFLSEDNLPVHPSLVISRSTWACIIECFLQARDHLPLPKEFKLDMKKLLLMMMEEAAPKPQDSYMEIKDAVLRIGQMHNIPEAAQRAIAANPNTSSGSIRKLIAHNLVRAGHFMGDMYRGRFSLDCSSLSVKNIYDASLLCDHILRLKDMNVLGFSTVLKIQLAEIKRIIVSA